MRHWRRAIAGPLSVLVAAILLPGGILLLAWTLYRRVSRSGSGEQRVKRWIPAMALLALGQGCATHLETRAAFRADRVEVPSARPVLKFQRLSIEPGADEPLVAPEALRPGDILLTSEPSLRAASIELVTISPVSHAAVYIGSGEVVEAVLPSVRTRGVDKLLTDEAVVLVLRYPDLTAEQARLIREYALQKQGSGFSVLGVTLQFPFSISRRVCEVPLVPPAVRDACIRGMGVLNQMAASERRLFCSQLVVQAYRHAGVQITNADPRLISPADILHMREGDVSSVRIQKPLRQVGHMKYERPIAVALQQM